MANLMKLDEYQEKAVTTNERNMLVVAAPGSGKTNVIINRVIHLINERKVNPSNIIVITFTKNAAVNMKKRFQGMMKVMPAPFFGTFHGLFYKLLMRNDNNMKIMEERDAFTLVNSMLTGYIDSVNEDKVREVLNDISLFKNSDMDLEDFKCGISKEIFYKCYQVYEEYKNQNGLMDFDDLQLNVVKLFENNPRMLESYGKLFRYILVDEFQDCDGVQLKILKMLGKYSSIFAVGDEDQCIYGFRGSRPECMVNFQEHFKNGSKTYLSMNYRSASNVVSLSKELISHNKLRNNKEIRSKSTNNSEIMPMISADERAQAESMSKLMKEMVNERGASFDDFAVLYRTNMESRSLIDAFMKNDIPFRILDKAYSFFDHFICRDLIDYLKLSVDVSNKESFLRIINKPFRYIGKVNLMKVRKHPYVDNCFNLLKNTDMPPFQMKNVEKIEDKILKLSKYNVREAVMSILIDLEYNDYIGEYCQRNNVNREDLQEVVDEFVDSCNDYLSIASFLAHIDEFKERIKSRTSVEGGVTVSTIHGVKGMEFGNVFIMNCVEGTLPHENSLEENLEEERRLFYVGMTRTKGNLYLGIPKSVRGKAKTMSRFIGECGFKGKSSKLNVFKKNQKVFHKSFGSGLVTGCDQNEVQVEFSNGTTRKFNIEALCCNKLMQVMEQ